MSLGDTDTPFVRQHKGDEMGARLVEPNPRIQAKLAKLSAKRQVVQTKQPATRPPITTDSFASDKHLLRWISQQRAQPSEAASLLLNTASIGQDGSFMFVPSLLPQISLQAAC
jgi:hypothetical protein